MAADSPHASWIIETLPESSLITLSNIIRVPRKRNPRPPNYNVKVCNKCHNEKSVDEFYKNRRLGATSTSYHSSWCKECEKEVNRRTNRARRLALRMLVLKAYGCDPPVCACCPEDEPSRYQIRFLTIDHIEPARRKSNSARKDCGTHLYEYLRDNNFPPGFRVLCFNCNCSTGRGGVCPHEEKRRLSLQAAD